MRFLFFLFPIFLQAQCLIPTDSYRLVCADEVRYADSIASGSRLYISSKNAFVTSPRSVFNLVNGYGQYFIQITNSANSQKVAINRAWVNRIDSTGAGKALVYIKDISVTFTTVESYSAVKDSAISCFQRAVASGLATLSDGDYGDVVVSGGGLVMTVDKPDLGLHNLADGDFSVVADSTALSLTGTRQITLQTQNIDGWISRYLQNNTSLTLRTNNTTKTSRIFVDTTGAQFQFVNGSNNASLKIGDSVAVRFNTSGSVGQVLTVTSVDGDGRFVINPKAGGSGTANCEQTLTKNSHGFSKWTPIYWNGSAWARPTYDSIIPTYIVVDSTSANTFKVANCGNYASSLTAGLYYYKGASPGYSLTPTSIPTPLFEVAQSRLILQPLVGFQLAGGSGGADGNGIYSGSDSLSQENTYAAMAADGSQNFGIGYFPTFPDYANTESMYGLFVSPDYYGEVTLLNGVGSNLNYMGASASRLFFQSRDQGNTNNKFGNMELTPGSFRVTTGGTVTNDKYWNILLDSVKFEITRNISGTSRTYNLLPASQYPSTTSGVTNILKWTAGVPSFGYRYETDSIYGHVNIKTAADGSQSYATGNWPGFPVRNFDYTSEHGLIDAPSESGEVTLAHYKDVLQLFDGQIIMESRKNPVPASHATLILQGIGSYAELRARDISGTVPEHRLGVDSVSTYIYGGATKVRFPNPSISSPSLTSSAISNLIWTAGTPSFLRSQHGVSTGTTDGSGDLTVTFAAAMPDATYTLIATVEGTTSYTISVHTKATGTCKVRFFNPATGAAVTATSVTISYEAKDY